MKPQNDLTPPVDQTRLLLSGLQMESFDNEMIHLYIKLLLNPSLSDKFQIVELRRRKQYAQLQLNQNISFDEIKNRLKMIPKFNLIIHRTRNKNLIKNQLSIHQKLINLFVLFVQPPIFLKAKLTILRILHSVLIVIDISSFLQRY